MAKWQEDAEKTFREGVDAGFKRSRPVDSEHPSHSKTHTTAPAHHHRMELSPETLAALGKAAKSELKQPGLPESILPEGGIGNHVLAQAHTAKPRTPVSHTPEHGREEHHAVCKPVSIRIIPCDKATSR